MGIVCNILSIVRWRYSWIGLGLVIVNLFTTLLFAQAPSVTVLTPNGGEVWSGATTQNITWTSTNIANVSLEYSTNNGSNWISITTWPASAGTYSWTVPGAGPLGSTVCLVRISDVLNVGVFDLSNANFTIPPSSITVLQPNGGEQWPVGSLQGIVWQHNSVLNIDIEYSTNNGSSWTTITTSYPALRGFYNWTIPSTVSSTCIVRVKDSANPSTVNDVSNSVFSITAALVPSTIRYQGGSFDGFSYCANTTPTVTVTSPNGGEVWPGATQQTISWTSSNIANNVSIEVSYNNGSNWTTITTWPASAGSYPWVVTGAGSTTCLVRVSDAQNSLVQDVSNANFTIPMASVTLLQPNGGEQWPVGSLQSIVWSVQSVNNLNLEYSTNNGSNWTSIATNQSAQLGFYNWVVPSAISNNCLVRVTDSSNGLVTDVSNAVFSIVGALTPSTTRYMGGSFDGFTMNSTATPAVTLTSPNGGEVWSGATQQMITWTYTNISNNVLLEYSTNNGSSWTTITTWPVTAGSYPWLVPGAGPLGSTVCLVRVSDAQNALTNDQSNANFTIPGSSVTVLQPNGGEQWPVGSLQAIVWSVQSVLNVDIEYSTNNGTNWTSIATNFPSANGFYNWTVPSTVSATCLVRVKDNTNPGTVFDISNANFSIIATLTPSAIRYQGGSYDGFTVCFTGCVPPSANLSGTQTLCTGGAATLTVNFTGSGPYSITYTNGTTPVTQTGITSNPYLFTVTPTVLTTYTLTSLTNACVSGPVTGVAIVTVASGPTAVISGTQTVCNGVGAPLSVQFTGTSPFAIIYTDGTSNTTVTGITQNPYVFTVTPTSTRTYSLTQVTSSTCSGGSVSGQAIVTVNPLANAVLSGNNTLCSGNPFTLSISLTGNFPWSIAYSNGTTTITQTGITSSPYLITTSPTQTTTYLITSVTNLCGAGTFSGQAIATVGTTPSSVISGSQTVCVGQVASLTATLNGVAPWTLVWTDGTSNQTITGITSSPYVWQVTPSSQTTYQGVSITSSGCSGTISGNAIISISTPPTAVLTGSQTLCGPGTAVLTATLGGAAPWSITWTNGTTNTTVTGITSSPYSWTVTPSGNQTYSLIQITSGVCVNNSPTGQAIISQMPAPLASITGSQSICQGSSATLSITLNGTAPWQFTYSQGTSTVNATALSSPYLFTVTPTSTGTWQLTQVTDACGTGTVSGQAVVSVSSLPTAAISGTQTICSGGSGNISISLTGIQPWNLTYSDGTNLTNRSGITSSPLIIGVSPSSQTTYSLTTVNDACAGVVSGQAIVSISPIPTATFSGTQSICPGNNAQLSVAFTGQSPWDFVWTDGTNTQTVTNITSSPYLFNVTPASTRTYSLVSLGGGGCSSGTFAGTPIVTVYTISSATLSGTQTICPGSGSTLTVNFTGIRPWNLQYSDGTNTTSISGITNQPYLIGVTPTNQTTYSLVGLSGTCGAGTFSGQPILTLRSLPTASLSGSQTICSGGSGNLSFALTGSSPWSLGFTDGTTTVTQTGITASPYIVSVTPTISSTFAPLTVTDVCSGTVSGQHILRVAPIPTAAITGTQTICAGSSAILTVSLTGQLPWSFVWSDGTNNTSVTGLTSSPYFISTTPSINSTYSLVSVSGGGCNNGTVSGNAIVTLSPTLSASISGNNTICVGSSATLTVSFTGNSPWNIQYSDGTTTTTLNNILSQPYPLPVSPTNTRTYTLVSVTGSCGLGTVSGAATVSVQSPPSGVLSGSQTICAGSSANLTVAMTGTPPWNIQWSDGTTTQTVTGITAQPYIISVTPITNTNYSLTSINTSVCLTGNSSGNASVTVRQLASATLSGQQSICTGAGAFLSVNLTGTTPWNFSWTDGTNTFSPSNLTQSPYLISVSPSIPTTYSLVSVGNGCGAGTATGAASVGFYSQPSAVISGNQSICPGNTASLSVSLTGNSPWSITYTQGTSSTQITGITTSPYVWQVTPGGNRTYTLQSVTSQCSGTVSGSAIIAQATQITATLSGSQTICPGSATQLSVSFSSGSAWQLSWSDGGTTYTQTGITSNPYLISITPVTAATYSLVNVSGVSCSGLVGGQAILSMIPTPQGVLSGSQTLCSGNAAQLSVALSGSSPWSLTWTDGTTSQTQTGITSSPYVWSVTPSLTSTFQLTGLTAPGCLAGTYSGNAVIQVNPSPSPATTSSSQSICQTSVVIGGNTPVTGTGIWNIISGSGTIANTSIPVTTVTGLGLGVNTFEWVITLGNCVNRDTILIYQAVAPPTANAGVSQAICGTTAQLSGSSIGNGNGLWTLISGGGLISQPTQAQTSITGLAIGLNVIRWQVNNGICPITSDTISIYTAISVAPANAGADQTLCGNQIVLSATSPAAPSFGYWQAPGLPVTFVDSTLSNTTVSGLSLGLDTLLWITVNAGCVDSDTVVFNRELPPVAGFTYTQFGFDASFVNLSSNELQWNWQFGDGQGSTLSQPHHTWQRAGTYVVTLIVSNACASDTLIDTLIIGGVLTDPLISEAKWEIFPNPAQDKVEVRLQVEQSENYSIKIYDALGRLVLDTPAELVAQEKSWQLNIGEWTKGAYQVVLYNSQKTQVKLLWVE